MIGNVALYGATAGKIFINGIAGERFCVRNSGAEAVVEGVGNHGCEYITGGTVVVLGPTGKNFAAGMSGGTAYVLDEKNKLYLNLNREMVYLEMLTEKEDITKVQEMIREHVAMTGSPKGQRILENFPEYIGKFRKVIPVEYKEMLELASEFQRRGLNERDAKVEAFYTKRKEMEA